MDASHVQVGAEDPDVEMDGIHGATTQSVQQAESSLDNQTDEPKQSGPTQVSAQEATSPESQSPGLKFLEYSLFFF